MEQKLTTFHTQEGIDLTLVPDPRGLVFTYMGEIEKGIVDAFNTGMKWSSLRSMVKNLLYGKRYINNDNSLHVWKKAGEMHILFKGVEMKVEKEVVLPVTETGRFENYLDILLTPASSQGIH